MSKIQIDCQMRLHELKDCVGKQLSYMEDYSNQLLKVLGTLIDCTYDCAPVRTIKTNRNADIYCLARSNGRKPQGRESILEQAIWEQWNGDAFMQHGEPFQDALCRHIQTYQMPLKDEQGDGPWGRIDLVGVSENDMPVVLELKSENSEETPLRILLEGLAYAIAVKKAWGKGCLRSQWKNCLSHKPKLAFTLSEVPIIGIAPVDYWKKRVGTKGCKRSEYEVFESAWEPFKKLCDACADHGYPVSFLQFTTEEQGQGKLPKIQKVPSRVNLPGF